MNVICPTKCRHPVVIKRWRKSRSHVYLSYHTVRLIANFTNTQRKPLWSDSVTDNIYNISESVNFALFDWSTIELKLTLCLIKYHSIKVHVGVKVQLHTFWTSVLRAGRQSALECYRFVPWRKRRRSSPNRMLDRAQIWFVQFKKKNLALARNQIPIPRSRSPHSIYCIYWAIKYTCLMQSKLKLTIKKFLLPYTTLLYFSLLQQCCSYSWRYLRQMAVTTFVKK